VVYDVALLIQIDVYFTLLYFIATERNLSVAVCRLGVFLRNAADDDFGRSYSAVDPREQFVTPAHLTDVHPARVAGRAEMSPE